VRARDFEQQQSPVIEYVIGSLLFELETELRCSGIQNNKLYGA